MPSRRLPSPILHAVLYAALALTVGCSAGDEPSSSGGPGGTGAGGSSRPDPQPACDAQCKCDQGPAAQSVNSEYVGKSQCTDATNIGAVTRLAEPSLSYCSGASCPGGSATMTTNGMTAAVDGIAGTVGDRYSAGWGIHVTYGLPDGAICGDASGYRGVLVCASGTIKNGPSIKPQTAQGEYTPDSSRAEDEQQQMLTVYLTTSYTLPADAAEQGPNTGACAAKFQSNCQDPFHPMAVDESQQTCTTIAWEDFEFPFWFEPNLTYWYPTECANTCYVGQDYADPPESVARWRACPKLADQLVAIVVAADDGANGEPVAAEHLQVSVELVP
jgi:hypothetical protein